MIRHGVRLPIPCLIKKNKTACRKITPDMTLHSRFTNSLWSDLLPDLNVELASEPMRVRYSADVFRVPTRTKLALSPLGFMPSTPMPFSIKTGRTFLSHIFCIAQVLLLSQDKAGSLHERRSFGEKCYGLRRYSLEYLLRSSVLHR